MRYLSVEELPPQMRDQARRQLGDNGAAVAKFEVIEARTPTELAPKKPSKYRNQRVFEEGQWFDSRLEYDCHRWLSIRQAAGEVAYFLRQVTFVLEGGVKYRCDFFVVLSNAEVLRMPEVLMANQTEASAVEVWDAKGRDTQASKNKRKQVRDRYGVEVQLWTKENRKAGC